MIPRRLTRLERMTRRGAIGVGLTGLAGCASGAAPTNSAPAPYVLPNSRIVRFTSKINNVNYAIYLWTPNVASHEPLPLVLTFDADYQFAIVANQLEHLADRGQIPPVALASIGYTGQYPSRGLYQLNRTRDYTPVYSRDGHYSPEAQTVSGGGPAFVRVINDEIMPIVEMHHPIDGARRTIVGHSYGGLFGAWLLCTRPAIFSRYLLVSPSLWYAEGMALNLARESGPPMPRPTRLFVGVGAEEEQPANNRRMVSQALQFTERLASRRDPQLDTAYRVFEGENHASIFPAAFSAGIRRLLS